MSIATYFVHCSIFIRLFNAPSKAMLSGMLKQLKPVPASQSHSIVTKVVIGLRVFLIYTAETVSLFFHQPFQPRSLSNFLCIHLFYSVLIICSPSIMYLFFTQYTTPFSSYVFHHCCVVFMSLTMESQYYYYYYFLFLVG
jgi:hypothetical protein